MKKWLNGFIFILFGVGVSAVILLVASPPRGKGIELLPPPTPAPIVIQVAGAVNQPGLYNLPRDSRVNAALTAAGGLRADADINAVNLAARLKDGEKLTIPVVGAVETSSSPVIGNTEPSRATGIDLAAAGPINLNTASAEALETLPGVGPARAQQIIDYRQANGGFKSIEEIQNIPGIGPATFEKMKDLIIIE